jgi:ketosteroid isomerase-like protein
VAESYWRAECARDIERVRQHYHPDAVFSPPGERLLGWENIKKWYEESFRQFPQVEVKIVHEISRGNEAALQWEAVLTDTAGVRRPLSGVNIIRVEEGKYREVHPYFDPTALK